jgi:hypothetical protein
MVVSFVLFKTDMLGGNPEGCYFQFFGDWFLQKIEEIWVMESDRNTMDITMCLTAYFTEKWRQIWFEFMTKTNGIIMNVGDWEYVCRPSSEINPHDVYWENLSANANTTMELVENNLKNSHQDGLRCLPWNFYAMSSNPNLTMEFVRKHKNKPWNWKELGKHEFAVDRKQYVEMQIRKVLLASIYDQNKNNSCDVVNVFGRILFDEYIMSKIIAY